MQKRKPPQSDARPSRSGPEFDCSHGWLAPDAKGTPVPGRDGWAKRVKHTDWWAVDEPDAVAAASCPPAGNRTRAPPLGAPPRDRSLPRGACGARDARILLVSFIGTPRSKPWLAAGGGGFMRLLANRLCFVERRGYVSYLEFFPRSPPARDDSGKPVQAMYYKPYFVRRLLPLADWLVWMDFDLIVTNPHHWFETYAVAADRIARELAAKGDGGRGGGARYDLVMSDRSFEMNNGGFMLRNSPWSRRFVDQWLALCELKTAREAREAHPGKVRTGNYTVDAAQASDIERARALCPPRNVRALVRIGLVRAIRAPAQSGPTDQGPFEVALDELAVPGVRPPPPAKPCPKGTDVIECFRAAFQRRLGPERDEAGYRRLGRVLFAGGMLQFNTHGVSTKFTDGHFILHNKDFGGHVLPSSIACAHAAGLVRRDDGGVATCDRLVGPDAPQDGRGLLLSRHGVCDTSEDACRKRSFPSDAEAAKSAFLPHVGDV